MISKKYGIHYLIILLEIWLIDFNGMSTCPGFLWLEVKDLHLLYVHICWG